MENFPHLPTLALVAAAVVALIFILNRWLFGPLNEILARRKAEIDSARAEFEAARRLQDDRLASVEARLAEARREAFSVREQAVKAGREARDQVLAEARADAMKRVDEARADIEAQVATAKKDLESEAEAIARRVAEQLLGRPVGGRS